MRLANFHMRIYRRIAARPPAGASDRTFEVGTSTASGGTRARHCQKRSVPPGWPSIALYATWALEDERAKPDTGNDGMYRVMRDILVDHALSSPAISIPKSRCSPSAPDGSTTWLYIAERLQAAGRSDEALAWAERGPVADAGHLVDWRLRAFLIERYVERNRGADALALAQSAFDRVPDLSNYQTLHGLAVRFGVLDDWRSGRWPAWRPAKWYGQGDGCRRRGPEQTLRVEALCWEGEFSAAYGRLPIFRRLP